VELAGVFVNAPLDYVVRIAEQARLSLVQLHGDEGPSYADAVAAQTGCRVIKAVPVRTGADLQTLGQFRRVDFHLLDSGAGGKRGGTGQPFDWALAREHRGPIPIIVGGGLRPENVAEAIAATRPYAVDVASGVEAEPGRKDPAKVEAFVAEVRRADRELNPEAAAAAAERVR
jgi:phosphoribosylanthranilate isomerase